MLQIPLVVDKQTQDEMTFLELMRKLEEKKFVSKQNGRRLHS